MTSHYKAQSFQNKVFSLIFVGLHSLIVMGFPATLKDLDHLAQHSNKNPFKVGSKKGLICKQHITSCSSLL